VRAERRLVEAAERKHRCQARPAIAERDTWTGRRAAPYPGARRRLRGFDRSRLKRSEKILKLIRERTSNGKGLAH
jgi:hypothetical protein